MLTWGTSKNAGNLPIIEKAEGVYLYDSQGKQYLDWTSQAVCTNLGHTVPQAVKDAINRQLDAHPPVAGVQLVAVLPPGAAALEHRHRCSALTVLQVWRYVKSILVPHRTQHKPRIVLLAVICAENERVLPAEQSK